MRCLLMAVAVLVSSAVPAAAQDVIVRSSSGELRIGDQWSVTPTGQSTVSITDPARIQSIRYVPSKSRDYVLYQRVNHRFAIRFTDGSASREVTIEIDKAARCLVYGAILGRRFTVVDDDALRSDCRREAR